MPRHFPNFFLIAFLPLSIATQIGLAVEIPALDSALNAKPDAESNPQSSVMLDGAWVPAKTHDIDFHSLPRVDSQHTVVSDVRGTKQSGQKLDHKSGGVNQHNFLTYHSGKYWAMWSDGPGVEDRVGQRVKFATSLDGLKWTTPKFLTPTPPDSGKDSPYYGTRTNRGFRWISRGFWPRDEELYALASLDEAAGFFGPSLALHAFRYEPRTDEWESVGVLSDNTINNFPPKKLPTGEWMMSRRPHNYNATGVHVLIGGVVSMDQWESYPVPGSSSELSAEEPLWWTLPDDNLMALFRDNRRSGYLYRAFSTDNGRSWSTPVRTNYPDATSKLHGLRLRDGRYVLVSNANPRQRDPLTIAISDDGMVFTKMGYLVGGRHVDYPYAMEHDGFLFVAFAGAKQSVEVLRIRLAQLDCLEMPSEPIRPDASDEAE